MNGTILLVILLWIETFTAAIIILILCAKIYKMAFFLTSELQKGNNVYNIRMLFERKHFS